MDRRLFLGLAAGAGLSTSTRALARAPRRRIAVIGGGILGASIALHCARAGARVTLFEKTAPAAGATSKSLAWMNPFVDDDHYMLLRLESIKRWHALDRALGMGATWGGYVGFSDRAADRGRFAVQARELAAAGFPTRALDRAALKQLSPEIDPGNLVEANWSELGGHVDPTFATGRYLAGATAAGARVVYPSPVTAIEPAAHGATVISPRGRLPVDHVIVAAGVDAPGLLAPLGYRLPLLHRPGALVHAKPLPILTRHVYDGPDPLEWKQAANGSYVGLEASGPPDLPVHAEIRDHAMAFPPGIADMHGKRILSKLAAYTPALARAEVDFVTLGFRPMPADEMPVVGPVPGVPGVSVCVTHSGVTLAAVLGAYMADEIVAGKVQPMLAPYRPDRAFPKA
jgi:glycine/D-amino acid oxidase-like deaminating enzyme